jgi:hypothetical protein
LNHEGIGKGTDGDAVSEGQASSIPRPTEPVENGKDSKSLSKQQKNNVVNIKPSTKTQPNGVSRSDGGDGWSDDEEFMVDELEDATALPSFSLPSSLPKDQSSSPSSKAAEQPNTPSTTTSSSGDGGMSAAALAAITAAEEDARLMLAEQERQTKEELLHKNAKKSRKKKTREEKAAKKEKKAKKKTR